MRKLMALIILALLIGVFAIPCIALAESPITSVEATNGGGGWGDAGFFSWAQLATYGGALLATVIIVQLFKGVGFISKIPTRTFAYVIALLIITGAMAFTTGITASGIVLALVNAGVISLAANGGYDAAISIIQSGSKD